MKIQLKTFLVLFIFLIVAACSYPLSHVVETRSAVPFIAIGMSKELLAESIGEPESVAISPFGREVWTFPVTQLQATYANKEESLVGWYLFRSHEVKPARLVAQFDAQGKLQSLSALEEMGNSVVWGE